MLKLILSFLFIFNICIAEEKSSASFFSGMTDQYLEEISKVNLFSKYTPEEMRKILQDKAQGNFMEDVFKRFPKFEDFLSHWFVSEEALPSFISIFKDKKKYKNFLVKSLVAFVIGILFISFFLRKETRFFKRIFKKLILMSALSTGLLLFFYFTFQEKLDPSIVLIREHLFS